MKLKRLFFLLPAATIAALVMVSCGNDELPCDAPLTLTPGTWCITLQTTQNTCGQPLDPIPYTADFTQDGNNLSALSQFGHTYAGTICGSNAVMYGNNSGITTIMDITFADASSASGSVDWDTGTCMGTDTFNAVAGSCP